MPFSSITSLVSTDTFQTLFIRNNQLIDRINELKIGDIKSDGSILISGPGISGGVTLGIQSSTIEKLLNGITGSVNIIVTGTIPEGLTLFSPIGITGNGLLGRVNNLSSVNSKKFIGLISGVSGSDSYTITTSGLIKAGITFDNIFGPIYYLNNEGGITGAKPSTANSVVKPVFLNMGITLGGIVLQQHDEVISEIEQYAKSSSRTVAEIPTNSNLIAGNVIYYNVSGSTWSKSQANSASSSEVFGVIESISGLTATIVTHGSVTIPSNILNSVGSGGAGGDDIWFLSAATAGHLQNQAPTSSGNIIKPIYYKYPHAMSGITFDGYLVNYIGYAVGGTVDDLVSTETSGELELGEFKHVSCHGNRLGFSQNWLSSYFSELIRQNQIPAQDVPWLKSVPYELRSESDSTLNSHVNIGYVELSGGLVLVEENSTVTNRSELTDTSSSGVNCLLTTDNPYSALSGKYESDKIPLDKFIDYGVSNITKIKTSAVWNSPANQDAQDRWAQLKRLWFYKTDKTGNPVKIINWTNANLILSDSLSKEREHFGDFNGVQQGIRQINLETLSDSAINNLKKEILTSFYLPGFIIKKRGTVNFPSISDSNGYIPIFSNWFSSNTTQEIGFFIPRQATGESLIYIYSPWWAINNNRWNMGSIDLYKFLDNCCSSSGINWEISGGDNFDGFTLQITPDQFLESVIGIHLPNYSEKGYKTLMRVL